jgi:hypothetical protein
MVALRDHLANDLESLCKLFGMNPCYRYDMENVLRQLDAAWLIVNTGPPGSFSGTFELIPNWHRIQATLGRHRSVGSDGSDRSTVWLFTPGS